MSAHINHFANIFSDHFSAYRKKYAVTDEQFKVVNAIQKCRTAAMGGHMNVCTDCGGYQIAYNSCRNRHCPLCQWSAKERWMMQRENDLIPNTTYFHTVFTMPKEFTWLGLANRKLIQGLMFQSTDGTLKQFAKNEFEGQIGFTQVLHTWASDLNPHFHIHCIIPGGYLTKDGKWHRIKKKYLFPVRAMSVIFKAIFCKLLRKAHKNNRIYFTKKLEFLNHHGEFNKFVEEQYSKKWVVYTKQAFKSAKSIVDYLGMYTHRVAIGNQRIKSTDNAQVTFVYRSRRKKSKGEKKQMTLDAVEFIRRYMCHILPKRMPKIRHYGFLAGGTKRVRLAQIFEQCGTHYENKAAEIKRMDYLEVMKQRLGRDLLLCPHCQNRMTLKFILDRTGKVCIREKLAA